MRGQPRAAGRGDRAARAPRHVVEDDRRIDLVGDRRKVAVHALVVRLVVVGGDQQQAVRAHGVIAAALLQLRLRAVGARAADDRNPSVHRLDDAGGDLVVLLVAHRARLARRAQRDDAVRPLLKMPGDQLLEPVKVDAAVLVEGRDQRDIASRKFHGGFLPIRVCAHRCALASVSVNGLHSSTTKRGCKPRFVYLLFFCTLFCKVYKSRLPMSRRLCAPSKWIASDAA